MSERYIEKIKENRIEYAGRHGEMIPVFTGFPSS